MALGRTDDPPAAGRPLIARTTGTRARSVLRLPATEFKRRFLLHVHPSGLQRIRPYGLLANRTRDAKLDRCRQLLGVGPPVPIGRDEEDYSDRCLRLSGGSLVDCSAGKHGHMVRT